MSITLDKKNKKQLKGLKKEIDEKIKQLEEKEDAERKTKAAIDIQNAWRTHKAKEELKTLKKEKEKNPELFSLEKKINKFINDTKIYGKIRFRIDEANEIFIKWLKINKCKNNNDIIENINKLSYSNLENYFTLLLIVKRDSEKYNYSAYYQELLDIKNNCELFKEFKNEGDEYTKKVINKIYNNFLIKEFHKYGEFSRNEKPIDIIKVDDKNSFDNSTIQKYYEKNEDTWEKFLNRINYCNKYYKNYSNFYIKTVKNYNLVFDALKEVDSDVFPHVYSNEGIKYREKFINEIKEFLNKGKMEENM